MNKLILLVFVFITHFAFAEKITAKKVLNTLDSTDQNEISIIIKQGVEQSKYLNGTTLILLSGLAFKNEDFENAGMFNYQCMVRVGVDIEVFPPRTKNRKNEVAKILALIHNLTPAFNEYVFYNPNNISKLIDPFSNWQPICDDSYDPGWIYEGEPDFKLCDELFEEKISGIASFLKDRSKLLNHKEYKLLLMEIEGPSRNSDLSLEDVENIENRMLAIEKELKIIGQITKNLVN
jgi:hypothetical protein